MQLLEDAFPKQMNEFTYDITRGLWFRLGCILITVFTIEPCQNIGTTYFFVENIPKKTQRFSVTTIFFLLVFFICLCKVQGFVVVVLILGHTQL